MSSSAPWGGSNFAGLAYPFLHDRLTGDAKLRALAVLPAPESAHAVKAAVDLAMECKARGEKQTILFNLSGHGYFDLAAYDAYFAGELENYELPREQLEAALSGLPAL